MAKKINLDGKEYELGALTETARASLQLLKFTDTRLQELRNTNAILRRAKNSYIQGLKAEMLSQKSGFLFDETE
jgi:hypothetical protein